MVMTSTDGRYFLAGQGGLWVEVDGLTAVIWPLLARGDTFGELQRRLKEAYPDSSHDETLREACVLLLTHRLVYMNDVRALSL
jgi:hypothetical protein